MNRIPDAPPVAHELFPETFWPLIERYVRTLANAGVVRGLLGPREVERIWERHILNCAVVAEVIPEGARLVDIGSGAGLPGVVLGIMRRDLEITLLEPLLRRTVFLNECVEELQLGHVSVVRGRAEELAGRMTFGVATARAVAPLDRLVRWSVPLLKTGGALLAMKGERGEAELASARPVLQSLGVKSAEILHAGRGRVDPPATLVRVVVGAKAHRAAKYKRVSGDGGDNDY